MLFTAYVHTSIKVLYTRLVFQAKYASCNLINEFVKSRYPKKFFQRINFSSRQFTYLLTGAYHALLLT